MSTKLLRSIYVSLFIILTFSTIGISQIDSPANLYEQMMRPGEWLNLGLYGLHVTALKIHPENPMILYAGTIPDEFRKQKGKLFKSSDAGITWIECIDDLKVIDIDVDQNNPGTVVVTSAKHKNQPARVYRSIDSGETWQEMNHPLFNRYERPVFLRISPWNSSHYFCATTTSKEKGYLYQSTDMGKSWQDITYRYFEGPPNDIAFNPFNENEIIISIENYSERPPLMRSLDNGKSWKHLWFFADDIARYIKFDPDSINTIHVGLKGKGVYTSYDNASNWTIRRFGLPEGSTTNDVLMLDHGFYTVVGQGAVAEVYYMDARKTEWERIIRTPFGFNPQLEKCGNFVYAGSNGIRVYWRITEETREVE